MADSTLRFPTIRPDRACYARPFPGQALEVSPPGFCWWRAAPAGECAYRLVICAADRREVYRSEPLDDPVHVPSVVLPAGAYRWTVELLVGEQVTDRWPVGEFSITGDACAQPWVEPAELLARVPQTRPRVLFPAADLDEVRATLSTTRAEAFESLLALVDIFDGLELPPEPTYDQLTDPAERRLAYKDAFVAFRKYHDGAMRHLALAYLLTGERRYGEGAKAILMATTTWAPEGVSSVSAPYGDELGLGIAKAEAEAYDWLHDLLDDGERAKVEAMIVARGDQMLRRLRKSDYLARPSESHNGRLPGYLLEHAVAVAEHPRAAVWVDYALRALMTVYPHWGGADGGWAEGMSYGVAYNKIFLTPFEVFARATGRDLWQRPFYRRVRRFFVQNISPLGEILPWGDMEDSPVPPRGPGIKALLQFHALKYRDPAARAWCELLVDADGEPAKVEPFPGIILPDDLPAGNAAELPLDTAFDDVGWATFHTAIDRPADDLMVMFKCSPYGGVSHSHADQNSFAILKAGRALAIPAGQRYPQHGTPFHTQYTQTTQAHNALLIDGQGQVNRDGNRGGKLTRFVTTPAMGLVTGDASNCYDPPVTKAIRHLLLIRPGLIVIVDEVEAAQPVRLQWLLHTKEAMELDEAAQTVSVTRGASTMDVALLTEGRFTLSQTDAWPMSPREGYPTASAPEPVPQWHLTAEAREPAAVRRIVAVIAIDGQPCELDRDASRVTMRCGEAEVVVALEGDGPVLTATFGAEAVFTD